MNISTRIMYAALLGSLCVLWSCTKEHTRTDISLEMTQEDNIEAIVDQDLITAGTTVVNVEDEPTAVKTSAVAYVDQVPVQKPVLIETDKTLKPGATGDVVSTDIATTEEPENLIPTGEPAKTIVKITPVVAPGTEAERLAKEASEAAKQPGTSLTAIRPPGSGTIIPTEYTTAMPVSYPRHTVQRGDTLWSISSKYGCSINDLAAANGISRRSVLQIGQSLVVPVAKQQTPAPTEPAGTSPAISTLPGDATGTSNVTAEAGIAPTEPAGVDTAKIRSVETETYTIQNGDSYWKLAKRFGITVEELQSLNDTTSDRLRAGQTILVPKK